MHCQRCWRIDKFFLDAAPEAERADFHAEPPSTWLVAHVLWTEAEHRIAAETAIARALEVANAAPCLLVERRTWRGPDTLAIVRQIFRGDALDLIARFGPNTEHCRDDWMFPTGKLGPA